MIDYRNPDYLPVFKSRIEALNRLRADAIVLEAVKFYYQHNPTDFISDWMMTYDPRKTPPHMPFILWSKQVEYINWLLQHYQDKEDGLVEKSRDAGCTYLNMAFSLWLWTFVPGSKVGFGSRKETLVDQIGNPDSIFEKGRMILQNLPSEFLPKGYNEKTDSTFMKIINRENGSTITGEAGDNIGRGGRNGLYFKDESSFYERPERIDAALSQNSDVKIDVSTPCGNGNPFWKKRHGGKIDVFIFDWRDDPRKDQAWYDHQKDTLEPWILAQEVDRDYNASVEGICIPARYVQAAVDLKLPRHGPVVAGLDVADEGGDKNSLIIRRGVCIKLIEAWKEGDTTQTARKTVEICNDHLVDLLNYDSIGVGAGVKGELKSLKGVYTDKGWRFPMVAGVNVGLTKLMGMYTEDRTDKDMFHNLRASLWWRMRRRFERTYEMVHGIKSWPVDLLISIPNDQELISELSQPLREITETGKIRIESKKKMRVRGIKSPNKADSLLLAFANSDMIPIEAKGRPMDPARLIHDYVTGKSKVHPLDIRAKGPGSGKKYIDFEEGRR